jgi:osmotically-inducible protein OsmY
MQAEEEDAMDVYFYQEEWYGPFYGKGPKGYRRADERIQEEVCEALTQNADVDASNIEVEVKDGVVTLSGTVDSRKTKVLAEGCIERLPGVKDVLNLLKISDAAGVPPTGLSTPESFMRARMTHRS